MGGNGKLEFFLRETVGTGIGTSCLGENGQLLFLRETVGTGIGTSCLGGNGELNFLRETVGTGIGTSCLGGNGVIIIFTGNGWNGNKHLVNWLGGTTGTMFARERELIPFPVKSCRNVPAGVLPEDCPEKIPWPGRATKGVQKKNEIPSIFGL